MKKASLRVTLTACTVVALIAAGGHALADSQLTTTPVSESSTIQQEMASREITVVDPDGQATVINQTANPSGNDETAIWAPYFPPAYDGYCPSRTYLPCQVVTSKTKSTKVKITYHPASKGDLVEGPLVFILDDLSGKESQRVVSTSTNEQGIVKLPAVPEGWEYVNADQLPDSFQHHRRGNDKIYHLLIQKKSPVPTSKKLVRTIILHLPDGDQTITQTVTATKKGTKWTVEPFKEYQVPTKEGYTASQTTVPTLVLPVNKLDTKLPAIEVNYQVDKGTGKEQEQNKDQGDKDKEKEKEPSSSITDGKQQQQETTKEEQDKSTPTEQPGKHEPADPVEHQENTKHPTTVEEPKRPVTPAIKDNQVIEKKPGQPNTPTTNRPEKTTPNKEADQGQHQKPVISKPAEQPGTSNQNSHSQEPTINRPTDKQQDNSTNHLPADPLQPITLGPEQPTAEMDDPELKTKLAQLQAPLNQLADESNMNNQRVLPQTGNQHNLISTLLGAVIIALVALTRLLTFNKKLNNLR